MKDFRVNVILDFHVDEEVDQDEFHDALRIALEGADIIVELDENTYTIETVRDIEVEELHD